MARCRGAAGGEAEGEPAGSADRARKICKPKRFRQNVDADFVLIIEYAVGALIILDYMNVLAIDDSCLCHNTAS